MSLGTLRACAALTLVALGGRAAAAQDDSTRAARWRGDWSKPVGDTSRLLYKGLGYGSDSYNSPLTVLLNKGYDIFQLRDSPRNILSFPYKVSFTTGVRASFQYPDLGVQIYGGWRRMMRVELLPLSFKLDELNWFANYTEHLLGGGFTMRLLDEWYVAHGYPLPRLWAMATTYAASVLNEITEVSGVSGPNAPAIADLLFFDSAAILLFHWDQPMKFFVKTLELADWSNQAALTLPNEQLQNNGQYFTMKIPIGIERTRFFVRGGMGAQFGLSRRLDEEHHLTVSVGGDTQARTADPTTGHETVNFAPGAGVFYDRNNSLLWSVTMSPAENLLAVNVYPGWMRGIPRDLGLWAVLTRHHDVRLGIVSRRAGLGLGYGR